MANKYHKSGQGPGEKYDMTDPNKGKSIFDMGREIVDTYREGKKREKEMFKKKK